MIYFVSLIFHVSTTDTDSTCSHTFSLVHCEYDNFFFNFNVYLLGLIHRISNLDCEDVERESPTVDNLTSLTKLNINEE